MMSRRAVHVQRTEHDMPATNGGLTVVCRRVVVAAAIAITCVLVVSAVGSALSARHMNGGFSFLLRPAGVSIPDGWIADVPSDSFLRLIAAGLANTANLALATIPLATCLGLVVGLARLSTNPVASILAAAYVGLFRTTPALLQILIWAALLLQLPSMRSAVSLGDLIFVSQRGLQFPIVVVRDDVSALSMVLGAGAAYVCLSRASLSRIVRLAAGLLAAIAIAWATSAFALERPIRQGLRFEGGGSVSPEFLAVMLGLVFYFGAFIAETVRSSIRSVPYSQTEAAISLGLSRLRALQLVVLPQACRAAIPPLTIQFSSIVKSTSLATVVGYPELFWTIGATVNATGRAPESVLIMMGAYLTLTLLVAGVMELANRHLLRQTVP